MKCFTVSLTRVWSQRVAISLLKESQTPETLSVLSRLKCNFVAVYFTSVQVILQLKLGLYTIVHLLLEEFKISLKSSLKGS